MAFYNNSAYRFSGISVPDAFVDLAPIFPIGTFNDEFYILADNICRRMADIDLYSVLIQESLNDPNPFTAGIKTGSFLVSYFGACKSFLDSGSITLNTLYKLALSNKEQDFTKERFWRSLEKSNTEVYRRYSKLRPLVNEIVQWRDVAVHRSTPLVMAMGVGFPGEIPREEIENKMISNPNLSHTDFMNDPSRKWLHPLDLHKKWRPSFIIMCSELCKDIKDKVAKQPKRK